MDNYKQIKSDLDQLRSIVEKSELWVYKRQGEDGMDADGPSESDHKKKVLGNTQPISKFPSAKDCWSTSSGKKIRFTVSICFFQGDSPVSDRLEGTSNYNYRVVKEVCSFEF